MSLPTSIAVGGHATDAEIVDMQKAVQAVLDYLNSGVAPSGAIPKSIGTTKGDLIVYNGTAWVRQGVGPDTQVLTADSTQAAGVKWAAGGGFTVVSKSASYSANAGECVLVSTPASNVLITLPAPSANAQVAVKDVSGFAGGGFDGTGKLLAVNAASGNVDGVSQVLQLNDYGGAVFVSDGSNWFCVQGADGVAADPRSIAGLQAWWDFSRGYTISNAGTTIAPTLLKVTQLNDLSGNGLTLTPTGSTGTVGYIRGGLTGRARGMFDGSASFLVTGNYTPPAASLTALLVGQYGKFGTLEFAAPIGQHSDNTAGDGFELFVNTNSAQEQLKAFVSGHTGTFGTGGRTSQTNGIAAANIETALTPHVYAWTIDGTTPYIHFDGNDVTQTPTDTSTITSPTASPIFIGQGHFGGAASDWFTGQMQEILLYAPSVSAANIAAIERYLMKRHGLRR